MFQANHVSSTQNVDNWINLTLQATVTFLFHPISLTFTEVQQMNLCVSEKIRNQLPNFQK